MPRPRKSPYTLTLKIGADTFKGSGATPGDALANLEKPTKLMAKGILVVEHEGKKKELAMTPVQMKSLYFTSRVLLDVKAKWIFAGLK